MGSSNNIYILAWQVEFCRLHRKLLVAIHFFARNMGTAYGFPYTQTTYLETVCVNIKCSEQWRFNAVLFMKIMLHSYHFISFFKRRSQNAFNCSFTILTETDVKRRELTRVPWQPCKTHESPLPYSTCLIVWWMVVDLKLFEVG